MMIRRSVLALGCLLLAAAWLGPLPELAPEFFAAHMGMHVIVVAVAAPMIAAGLAGSRADPVRLAPRLFTPVLASVLEFVVVWGWHAPLLHHAARTHAQVMAVEQAMFLAVALLLWLSAFGGDSARRPARAAAGIGGLLLTSMHMTLLGALLALSPRPLYPHGPAEAALADQHFGGVLMLLVGGSAYLFGGLCLLAMLLRQQRSPVPEVPRP